MSLEKYIPNIHNLEKSGLTIQTYSQVPLKRSLVYHDITYDTAITVAESESDTRITINTTYLTLTGELWFAYCEHF